MLFSSQFQEFLDPLDIRKITGIGSKTAATLRHSLFPEDEEHDMTVSNVRNVGSRQFFLKSLEQQTGERLWDLINGRDDSKVISSFLLV